ncbi:MAG TPA: archease [Nanoarchaeota archaeon]|nr:archease [Candidatus Woesearchaeota archaeon]HIH58695.1 archease [Nanoarchaeota archaeon]HII14483.1 archease [Nanoarchaeota archaeon]HIJ04894.1 archease [Nanoarchaeota archaeon]
MKPYEFLPHTADVKFLAYGESLEEAFGNAALATFATMTDIKKVKAKSKKTVSVQAHDYSCLLYSFLEDLLFLLDTEDFCLSKITVSLSQKDDSLFLEAESYGDNVKNYETHTLVKAVTYHEMTIQKLKKLWVIQVILDV